LDEIIGCVLSRSSAAINPNDAPIGDNRRVAENDVRRAIRAAQMGMLVNAALAVAKLIAGIAGHAYALVADAAESTADVLSSVVVWGGLHVSSRDPDEDYPFGYGKAESLSAAVVALMLLGAGLAIAIQAVREIRTPHHLPAPWTLAVLVAVVVVKWTLSRRVGAVGSEVGSSAVRADAWHHLSDAITSGAAFIGISLAVLAGPGWESADDWAALVACAIIVYNGARLLRPALADLMDRSADAEITAAVRSAAEGVFGVRAVEKLAVRKVGMAFEVAIHVHADPFMNLEDAHALGGLVKATIRDRNPRVRGVLVHMEPYHPEAVVSPPIAPHAR
jgi:cation diffusion facilitator family transporter